ncbi:hypothetical protein G3I27_33235, partial [Streptomyces sp. SID10692]|nr:hypothetical protein [Streptomyces sp. SID10692]
AAHWAAVAAAAAEGADGIWKNIAGPAGANQQSWTQEGASAAGSAAYWQDMLKRAEESEERVRETV